jgi:type I restriction enzyme R subunit
LDFRNATDLFADPDFDGDPIRIKDVPPGTDAGEGNDFDDDEEDDGPVDTGGSIVDGPEVEPPVIRDPPIRGPQEGPGVVGPQPRQKVYVNGVDVSVLVSRELYFDHMGKPITISLKDYTKNIIKEKYSSLDDFLNTWNSVERKEAIIAELQEQGIMVDALYEAVNREVDLFDLICHVAFDQPPLTRKERANNVKKRNYFTKYGDQAKKVLEALLDKYADEGVTNIENIEVLRVNPFNEFGSPVEIIREFGSKEKYFEAVKELENELYKIA